jgi:hypothetical protein
MDGLRSNARRAAQLQIIADQYRQHARRAAPDSWSLEQQASTIDALAAAMLTIDLGRPTSSMAG